MKISSIVKNHSNEILAVVIFLVGAVLGLLGLIQIVPLLIGVLGLIILSSGLIYFCIKMHKFARTKMLAQIERDKNDKYTA
jgi:hypothetical protein